MSVAGVVGSIPSPSFDSIQLGPIELHLYGLTIALGVVAAVWLMGRQLEAKGLGTRDDAAGIAVWAVAAGVVGARLYHVITDWDRFADDPAGIVRIWEGGLGIPGGLLLGIAVGAWQGRRRGIPVPELLTCAAPAIPLAQAIGRWGNWFNQELYGRPTDLPWGLEIDDPPGYAAGTTFHPTFLYESLWNLGLVFLLLWIDRRFRLAPGRLMAVYVLGYGLGRFWIEGLRIDPASELAGLRLNQWVSLAAIVGGAGYLLATRGRRWETEAAPADDEHDDGDDIDGDDIDGEDIDHGVRDDGIDGEDRDDADGDDADEDADEDARPG